MIIYLFGATTPAGQAFRNLFKRKFSKFKLLSFSRDKKKYNYLDLDFPESFSFKNEEEFLIVSFAPIWKLSRFLENIFINRKDELSNLCGIIACSSSSIYTKKYSYNAFDKKLYSKLKLSEIVLSKLSESLKKSVYILEPTMIYGDVGEFKDKNINKILTFLNLLPFLLIPSETGLRQPIHAYQLAAVTIKKLDLLLNKLNSNKGSLNKISLGGDKEFTFFDMVSILKSNYLKNRRIRSCCIIRVPNRIYYILFSPLIIISPKLYESLLRLNGDLSGFTKSSYILDINDVNFPAKECDFLDN